LGEGTPPNEPIEDVREKKAGTPRPGVVSCFKERGKEKRVRRGRLVRNWRSSC